MRKTHYIFSQFFIYFSFLHVLLKHDHHSVSLTLLTMHSSSFLLLLHQITETPVYFSPVLASTSNAAQLRKNVALLSHFSSSISNRKFEGGFGSGIIIIIITVFFLKTGQNHIINNRKEGTNSNFFFYRQEVSYTGNIKTSNVIILFLLFKKTTILMLEKRSSTMTIPNKFFLSSLIADVLFMT